MKVLIIIPARAGSKELPGKNTKLLNGKPLVAYSIEFAMKIRNEGDVICVTSNDDEVIRISEGYGLEVPFKRPEELATDQAGTYEVILHAMDHYRQKGYEFGAVLLLQPTSPIRLKNDYDKMVGLFDKNCEMVVSVKQSKESPYFTLFEENGKGYLEKSKKAEYKTRQDCPPVYIFNGSMYLIAAEALYKSRGFQSFTKIVKIVMPEERSIDIDSIQDWIIAEYFLNHFNK